ncbi:BrnA antitoxin family protein [Burkholderia guangdongensis]|uniref:BrnA antitoxin family protein n=1 Tax=Burkholderia guangdongensis TaxID=1792500 RepID=UPI0015C70471|nr:BrnA antitoxin family protein [Burkholderia guangdongensis]
MTAHKPLVDEHGEVREIADADLTRFKPASEVLCASLRKKVGVRGPQKAPTKVQTSIRLSAPVIDAFRASGTGWQTRIDVVLTNWLKRHAPEEIEV